MSWIRITLATLIFLLLSQAIFADDDVVAIDKERVFPTQKNKTVIHDSSKNSETSGDNSTTSPSTANADKRAPKDTSLSINGNGGSTNRAAGGNAVLRKRFTFD